MNVSYDRQADVLAVMIRNGKPKYVVVGKGTFMIFADNSGKMCTRKEEKIKAWEILIQRIKEVDASLQHTF
jgi:hypothetical protein